MKNPKSYLPKWKISRKVRKSASPEEKSGCSGLLTSGLSDFRTIIYIFAASRYFMQLIEIKDQSSAPDFIKANVELNRNNPNYIRPMDNEINEVFDSGKNKA